MEEMQNLHAVRKLPLSIRSSQLSTEASIEVTAFSGYLLTSLVVS